MNTEAATTDTAAAPAAKNTKPELSVTVEAVDYEGITFA